MDINYRVADNAQPQVKLLLGAVALSIGVWVLAWVFPIASYLYYPMQLFATFIHESSHALAAIITGNSVSSLTVSPDTSGAVWSSSSGISGLFISSAGYLGTTAFGTLLLAWIRFGRSPRPALYFSASLIGLMTIAFGLILPFYNFLENVTVGSIAFTVFAGLVISAGLFAVARYAPLKWAQFAMAVLSVQCLLNAFFSLKDLFVISALSTQQTDAANMAAATGIPALFWAILWIAISAVMIVVGIRMYAIGGKKDKETLFIDGPTI